MCGVREGLLHVIGFLTDRSYRNRCAAANILGRGTRPADRAFVVTKLSSRLARERARSVRSSLRDARQRLRPEATDTAVES
jgi:hypothetical protein